MNAKKAEPDDKAPDDVAQDTAAESQDPVASSAEESSTPADEPSTVESPSTESADVDDSASVAAVSDPGTESAEAVAPVQTVYVTAPTPPQRKGNRGIGILLAVVAAIVFAAVYAGASALMILFVDPNFVPGALTTFVIGPLFYVPVIAFLVLMIVWALLVNRASWWAWVIGSLLIAAGTYFATIGVLLLLSGGFGMTASEASLKFVGFAINPALIAAAIIARESAIWFGAAIAKRGRRVRERNYEAWMEFENEQARKKADVDGVAAV